MGEFDILQNKNLENMVQDLGDPVEDGVEGG